MARMARVVVPGIPHHVTQRGNRRQQTFFHQDDYIAYLDYLLEGCTKADTEVWAYCLMPNHVHLLLCPSKEDGLRAAIADAHRKYTRRINFRERWRGHLWQDRFASFPMDETHTLAAARYIELNPVRARMVHKPQDYAWSSAAAHMRLREDKCVDIRPLLRIEPNWSDFLNSEINASIVDTLRKHENTGRPLGDKRFIAKVEMATGKIMAPQKPGPKPKPST